MANNNKSIFSINLIRARQKMGLTQNDAAPLIGINRSRLGSYEEDRAEPDHETLIKICNAYKIVDVYRFLTDREFLSGPSIDKLVRISELEKRYLNLTGSQKKAVDVLMGID